MKQHTWRAARATCVLAIVVMVAAVVAVASLVLITVRGVGHLGVVITLGVLALAGIVYLWRFALYPKIVLDERLTVVNPLRTHIIDLDEPRSIEPGPNGLRITTDDGVVEAWCVQKSTGAIRKHQPARADEVADQISHEIDRRLAVTRTAGVSIPDAPGLAAPAAASAGAGTDRTEQDHSETAADQPETEQPETERSETGQPDTRQPDTEQPDTEQPEQIDTDDVHEQPLPTVASEPEPAGITEPDPTVAGHAAPTADDEDTGGDGDDEEDDEDELIIRRAHRDELEVLVGLEETINTAALGTVFGPDAPFPTVVVTERWREALADRRIKVRIAEIGGRPIGYLSFDPTSIHQIGVLAAHTRQGHGSALLDYALTDIVRGGCTTPTLMVLEANQPARAFYQALGWRDTGDREVCEHPPHPTEMKLVLDRSAG